MSGERQWRWDGSNWTYWNGEQWTIGQPEPGEIPGGGRGFSGASITAIVLGALLGLFVIGGGVFLIARALGGDEVVTLQSQTVSPAPSAPPTSSPTPSAPTPTAFPAPVTPSPQMTTPAPPPTTAAPSGGEEAQAAEMALGRLGACGIDVLEADVSPGSAPGVYVVSMYANSGEVYDVTVNVTTGSMTAASQLSAELEFDCPGIFG